MRERLKTWLMTVTGVKYLEALILHLIDPGIRAIRNDVTAIRAELQDVRHALSIPAVPGAPPAPTYDHPHDPHWGARG